VERDIDGLGALEFDTGEILVKEWFKEDDFFPWIDVRDEGSVRAWRSAGVGYWGYGKERSERGVGLEEEG
jgi:hypothetical protein